VCREAVPQLGGEDCESPLADGSKVEGWHDQVVGGRRSKSLLRWHISDLGEVERQIRGHTAVHCSVGEYGDFEEDALWNTKPVKTGEHVSDVL